MIKRAILVVLFLVNPCLARTGPPRDGGATITGGESAPYYSPAEPPDAPIAKPVAAPAHRFYDKWGKIELTAAFTVASADSAITCHNLANGGREVWQPTQSCAGNVALLLGGVAAQEGVAYAFHRIGWHKPERVVRFFTIEESLRAIHFTKEHGGV